MRELGALEAERDAAKLLKQHLPPRSRCEENAEVRIRDAAGVSSSWQAVLPASSGSELLY